MTALIPFLSRRLLVTSTAPNGASTIGVAHETFLSAWPPLRDAVASTGAALRARSAIEVAADEWSSRGKPRSRLWEKGQLSAALADIGETRRLGFRKPSRTRSTAQAFLQSATGGDGTGTTEDVDLNPLARAFLSASIRNDRFKRNRLVAVLLALLLTAGSLAVIATERGNRLDLQLRAALADTLGRESAALATTDAGAATQLALAAWRSDPTTPAAVNALATSYMSMRSIRGAIPNATSNQIRDLLTADEDRTLLSDGSGFEVLTNVGSLHPSKWSVPGVPPGAEVVHFDGPLLVMIAGNQILSWDVQKNSGPQPFSISRPTKAIKDVSTSPDGSRIAVLDSAIDGLDEVELLDSSGEQVGNTLKLGTADAVWVRLTDNLSHILVGFGSPGNRVESRSLANTVQWSAPGVVLLSRTSDTLVTCDPQAQEPDATSSPVYAAIRDPDSGVERASPAKLSCNDRLEVTGDRDHIATRVSGEDGIVRITDVKTGESRYFMNPPSPDDDSSVPPAVVHDSQGIPLVATAHNSSLLLATMELDKPEGEPAGSGTLSPRGQFELISAKNDGRLSIADVGTGRVVGSVVDPAEDADFTKDDFGSPYAFKGIWDTHLTTISRKARVWHVVDYALPSLDVLDDYIVPGPSSPTDDETFSINQGDDGRIVSVVGGVVAVRNTETRTMTDPFTLGDSDQAKEVYRKNSGAVSSSSSQIFIRGPGNVMDVIGIQAPHDRNPCT